MAERKRWNEVDGLNGLFELDEPPHLWMGGGRQRGKVYMFVLAVASGSWVDCV